MSRVCRRAACKHHGAFIPALILHIRRPAGTVDSFAWYLELEHCEDCIDHSTIATLLTDRVWKCIASIAARNGQGVIFDREKATLKWVSIGFYQKMFAR